MVNASDELLSALDKAKTQWYHFTTIIIAGMGFFTDAYDLSCISTVTRLLGRIFYYNPADKHPSVLPADVAAALNGVALCSTLIGQLLFGWLGDKLGRKRVYGWTHLMMIITLVASAMSFGHTPKAVMSTLCFFRIWLGVGVGGDYSLSATIMSKYANQKTRGAFIAAVFAVQGVGILGGATMSIVVSVIFRNALHSPSFVVDEIVSTPSQADYVWRIVLAANAFPATLKFYYRMKMPETARYTALVARNNKQAAMDMSRVLKTDFARHIEISEPNFEFFDYIIPSIGWLPAARTMSVLEEVFPISRVQALIALVSTVLSYWVTVALVDVIGRCLIQMVGFFFMTMFMVILSLQYYTLGGDPCGHDLELFCGNNHTAFLTLYSLTFFFANFGTNVTAFIIPTELFPARLMSTCHGISAAAEKEGATVGAFRFLYAAQSPKDGKQEKGYKAGIGLKISFLLLSVINAAGFLCTFLVPKTKGRSRGFVRGERRGDFRSGARCK